MTESGSLLVNTIGVGAALCSMASFIPQAFKLIKDRDASSISLRMYVVTVTGFALWSAYGALVASWPLIASNLISLGLSGVILALKIWMPSLPKERP